MESSFKNILLPIDFSSNTHLEVKKAVDLADIDQPSIHLVHIIKRGSRLSGECMEKVAKMRELMQWLEIAIPSAHVRIYLLRSDSPEDAIVELAKEQHVELIIVARRSGRKFFSFQRKISPARLANKSHCAVLTIKAGSENIRIKSIVVPFSASLPKRKLDVLLPLAWKKNIIVYLVAMQNELTDFETSDSSVTHTLIETYRQLKEDVNCQVFQKFISGNNIAKAMLHFAESVNADVLLAYPNEIKISALAGLDISDMLDRSSKMQLLTIAPENYC